jgi:hypothetical protein
MAASADHGAFAQSIRYLRITLLLSRKPSHNRSRSAQREDCSIVLAEGEELGSNILHLNAAEACPALPKLNPPLDSSSPRTCHAGPGRA